MESVPIPIFQPAGSNELHSIVLLQGSALFIVRLIVCLALNVFAVFDCAKCEEKRKRVT